MKRPRKGFYWRWDIPDTVTITEITLADEGGMVTLKKGGHWYTFTFDDPWTVIKRNSSSPDWKWK